jgi:hypothetical protein
MDKDNYIVTILVIIDGACIGNQIYWILTSKHYSHNYCPFRLIPFSGEGGGKTPTQFGPLERANLNHRHQGLSGLHMGVF